MTIALQDIPRQADEIAILAAGYVERKHGRHINWEQLTTNVPLNVWLYLRDRKNDPLGSDYDEFDKICNGWPAFRD